MPVRVESPGYAAPCWADLDDDGKKDLLLGDMAPLVSLADGITDQEFKQEFAEWNNSLGEAVRQLNSGGNDRKKRDKKQ